VPALRVPPDVAAVLRDFYTCEATTVNRQGQPITWPALPYYDEENGQLILTASIAFCVKAQNARRNPHIALLYSEPTGTSLAHAPAVLVQGDATVAEMLEYDTPQIRGLYRAMKTRQPDSRRFLASQIAMRLFAWYLFQRAIITVQPRRILVWPERDFSQMPSVIELPDEREVPHVE
jgi:hypothetical protein